jgi:hypothetical protein
MSHKAKEAAPVARSWGAQVIADNSGEFCGNGLRFATKAEAEAYAEELRGRWSLVRATRAVPLELAPNYAFEGGAARALGEESGA